MLLRKGNYKLLRDLVLDGLAYESCVYGAEEFVCLIEIIYWSNGLMILFASDS